MVSSGFGGITTVKLGCMVWLGNIVPGGTIPSNPTIHTNGKHACGAHNRFCQVDIVHADTYKPFVLTYLQHKCIQTVNCTIKNITTHNQEQYVSTQLS